MEEKIIINVNDFANRDELERYVILNYGKTPDKKQNVTISGTRADLIKKFLTDGQSIWGVVVECTDPVVLEKSTVVKRPDRGKIFDSKINGVITRKNAKTNKSSDGGKSKS